MLSSLEASQAATTMMSWFLEGVRTWQGWVTQQLDAANASSPCTGTVAQLATQAPPELWRAGADTPWDIFSLANRRPTMAISFIPAVVVAASEQPQSNFITSAPST